MGIGTPPRQANLPKGRPQITEHQTFNTPTMARVSKTDDFYTKGRISVTFLNRTSPAPIWVLDPSVGKPEVGDYVIVGYIDGQKNNPYMAGLMAHQAYTSNFVRVEKGKILIQFPTQASDVTGTDENDPKNHLRDDSKLSTRSYVQIDANGVTVHAPAGLPVNINADTVNIKDHAGGGSLKAVARVGDTVTVGGSTGTITSGSSTLQSV